MKLLNTIKKEPQAQAMPSETEFKLEAGLRILARIIARQWIESGNKGVISVKKPSKARATKRRTSNPKVHAHGTGGAEIVKADDTPRFGTCPSCGEAGLVVENGCVRCFVCLYSKCD